LRKEKGPNFTPNQAHSRPFCLFRGIRQTQSSLGTHLARVYVPATQAAPAERKELGKTPTVLTQNSLKTSMQTRCISFANAMLNAIHHTFIRQKTLRNILFKLWNLNKLQKPERSSSVTNFPVIPLQHPRPSPPSTGSPPILLCRRRSRLRNVSTNGVYAAFILKNPLRRGGCSGRRCGRCPARRGSARRDSAGKRHARRGTAHLRRRAHGKNPLRRC